MQRSPGNDAPLGRTRSRVNESSVAPRAASDGRARRRRSVGSVWQANRRTWCDCARNRIDTLVRVATAPDRHLVVPFPEKVPAKLKDDVQLA